MLILVYYCINDTCDKRVIYTLKTLNMKRVIITICDGDTGEIFAGTRKDVPRDGKTAQQLFEKWFKSFIRGLDQKENLSITLTYREKTSEYDLFPDFMKK